jgi:hypothetical protein
VRAVKYIREYGRTAAIFSAAALVLSLLVGIIARNPFSTAILRALLFAVVFALLGGALHAAIRRWLPELGGGSAESVPPAEKAGGRVVDIVLPEEGYSPQGAAGNAESEVPMAEEADELPEDLGDGEETGGAEESLEPIDAAGVPAEPMGDEDGAAAAEEVEGGAPAASAAAEAPPSSRSARPADQGGEPAVRSADGEPASSARSGRGALPDLGDIGSPAARRGSGAGTASRPGPARRADNPEEALRGVLANQDTATLAKAVRTVLKRDEKG